MNNLSSSMNNSVVWRRSKVLELSSQGYNQSEISRILQISQPTINRDISYLRQQAKSNIKRYIDERLPEEYEKCLVGLNAITKEARNTGQNTEDKREKIQALSLAKECYSMKMDLLTNATVVDDAIRFVSQKSKDSINSTTTSNEDNELKEPDYGKDEDQLEQEQEVIQEAGGIRKALTNQVF
jgi:predicted transcriptional regulator